MIVGVEGSGETAKFTFTGVPKPSAVPDGPVPVAVEDDIPAKFQQD